MCVHKGSCVKAEGATWPWLPSIDGGRHSFLTFPRSRFCSLHRRYFFDVRMDLRDRETLMPNRRKKHISATHGDGRKYRKTDWTLQNVIIHFRTSSLPVAEYAQSE